VKIQEVKSDTQFVQSIIGNQFLIKPKAIDSIYCFMASVLKLTEISSTLAAIYH